MKDKTDEWEFETINYKIKRPPAEAESPFIDFKGGKFYGAIIDDSSAPPSSESDSQKAD